MQPVEDAAIRDRFGRSIHYLRLSVTDRCDLRCSYCMPEGFRDFEEPAHWLGFEEIERLVGVFARLGIRRVRLTGGEPLLRRDLPRLAAMLSAIPGIEDLSISTNATQLTRHAEALRRAGASRINVSLDSLQRERVERISRRDVLDQVLDGLHAAKVVGFSPIKINTVVMKGVNDDEIEAMAEFCAQHGFVWRLIETMPMGETGRAAPYVDLQSLRTRLQQRYGLVEGVVPGGGPAHYLVSPDGCFNIGFITPISRHFCPACNRVRLAVDGTLYTCLGQEDRFEFGPLLRGGASDEELAAGYRHALQLKPRRHEFREKPTQVVRFMSRLGG